MSATVPDLIRADFPILATRMNGKPLIYFDNAATTQKPQAVIDAIVHYYQFDNANVHRGMYELSQRATDRYEAARKTVARFLGVADAAECIFTRGTTESINLVAHAWGRSQLQAADEILLSGLEHHSNIVPWQMACQATGAQLQVVEPDAEGRIDIDRFAERLTARTRLVAIQHTSNALGTIHDVQRMVELAHQTGALVLVDGAQSVAHQPTNLSELQADFFAFSGHKLYGPTGIGVLWGRRHLLESMPPWLGGGDMIESVTFARTTYAGLPNRFEAGTPHIAGAIGLAAAIDYLSSIGLSAIAAHEQRLLLHATRRLREIPGVRLFGQAEHKTAIISFDVVAPPIAALDVATALALEGIAIRTGHHCCMPLMQQLGVPGTCRLSLAFYNTLEEIDRLAEVLRQLIEARQADAKGATARSSDSPASSAIVFATTAGASPAEIAAELVEEFALCDDPQSKTEFLLELGQQLPDAFAQLKALTSSVPGCMSEVYLLGRPTEQDPQRIEFAATQCPDRPRLNCPVANAVLWSICHHDTRVRSGVLFPPD